GDQAKVSQDIAGQQPIIQLAMPPAAICKRVQGRGRDKLHERADADQKANIRARKSRSDKIKIDERRCKTARPVGYKLQGSDAIRRSRKSKICKVLGYIHVKIVMFLN